MQLNPAFSVAQEAEIVYRFALISFQFWSVIKFRVNSATHPNPGGIHFLVLPLGAENFFFSSGVVSWFIGSLSVTTVDGLTKAILKKTVSFFPSTLCNLIHLRRSAQPRRTLFSWQIFLQFALYTLWHSLQIRPCMTQIQGNPFKMSHPTKFDNKNS